MAAFHYSLRVSVAPWFREMVDDVAEQIRGGTCRLEKSEILGLVRLAGQAAVTVVQDRAPREGGDVRT